MIRTICEPPEAKRRPANAYAAQFSLPYIVAASLVRGQFTLAELDAGTLANEEVLSLAALVEHEADPLSDYPKHFSGELRIRLKDGTELAHREAQITGVPSVRSPTTTSSPSSWPTPRPRWIRRQPMR